MARDRTLLERLANPDSEERHTVQRDSTKIVGSVMRNLQRLLNTRQGQVLIQPEYGLPDITDCAENLPEALERISRAIKDSIERYEPRLTRVKIVRFPAGNDLNLHFGISGQIVTEREHIPVHFNTTVNPSGSAVVTAGQDPGAEAEVDRRLELSGQAAMRARRW